MEELVEVGVRRSHWDFWLVYFVVGPMWTPCRANASDMDRRCMIQQLKETQYARASINILKNIERQYK